jgi:hypothetical protein
MKIPISAWSIEYVHAPPLRTLSLPEEFALLSLTDSGKPRDSAQAVDGCAAAELGELALRRKLLVRSRKSEMLGFDAYRPHPAEIQLLDTSPTGLVWADDLLAELGRRCASGHERIVLRQWLRQRRGAFSLHRDALAEYRVLHHKPGRHSGLFRFIGRERYYPDSVVRNALITTVRAASSGQSPLDEHMLFLSDLVGIAGLHKDLGFELSLRHRLDRGRGGGAVESLPEDLRDTSAVLASSVPKKSRHQD